MKPYPERGSLPGEELADHNHYYHYHPPRQLLPQILQIYCVPLALTGPLGGVGPHNPVGPSRSTKLQLIRCAWRQVKEGVVGDPSSEHCGQVGVPEVVCEH